MKRFLLAACCLLIALPVLSVQAQESPAPAGDGGAAVETPTTAETFGAWTLLCQEGATPACRAVQRLDIQNEGGTGRLLQATVVRNPDGVLLILELPFGLDLRAGIVIQFDDNDEIPLPFTTCYSSGCQVIALLAPEHEEQFRIGDVMRVGFRGMGQEQTLVAEVSLSGSGRVLAQLPLSPSAPESVGGGAPQG